MSADNSGVHKAKDVKNDEFYTLIGDIEKEVAAYVKHDKNTFKDKTVLLPCDDPEWSNFTKFFVKNFKNLGLKKLISTCFAINSKAFAPGYQVNLFETAEQEGERTSEFKRGKLFTLNRDNSTDNDLGFEVLKWEYLQGDGDFASDEITDLLKEADIVVTNPPFSLFRDFFDWLIEHNKHFLIIGGINAITYKQVFPLIKDNKVRLGQGCRLLRGFETKNINEVDEVIDGVNIKRVAAYWFTNLKHGYNNKPLDLMTMAENIKRNDDIDGYAKFDGFDAINVDKTKEIPADYAGVMGVPVSFIEKFCPEQFELLGVDTFFDIEVSKGVFQTPNHFLENSDREVYKRIWIRNKKNRCKKNDLAYNDQYHPKNDNYENRLL